MEFTDGARGAMPAISDGLPASDRDFMCSTGLVRLTSAARWLGVSPATLRRHVHDGHCAGRKFDGNWFVGRGTVERWAMRRRTRRRGG